MIDPSNSNKNLVMNKDAFNDDTKRSSHKKIFTWYKYIIYPPIIIGLILILLVLSGVITDTIAEDGVLIENGFRTYALGCMLTAIGLVIIVIHAVIKKIIKLKLLKFFKDRF